MKYILLHYCESGDPQKLRVNFSKTDDIQEVFEHLKYSPDNEAYKLGGEITSMEDAVKKEV